MTMGLYKFAYKLIIKWFASLLYWDFSEWCQKRIQYCNEYLTTIIVLVLKPCFYSSYEIINNSLNSISLFHTVF